MPFQLLSTIMSPSLTESQRRLYALEKTENFRWVSTMLAKASDRHLTSQDLAPLDLQTQLSDIGQYAELALGKLPPPKFIWDNMDRLLQPNFPLEGYNALPGSELVSSFKGSVGSLQGYVARKSDKLIVAFSGTSNLIQSLNNFDVRLRPHSAGGKCAVHAGFWRLYDGVRTVVMDELARALQQGEVHELILTGHSLGGAACYLFALDLLQSERKEIASELSSKSVTFTLSVFGCPRVGNLALVQHWRKLCADRVSQGLATREYSVKGYKDGQFLALFVVLASREINSPSPYHIQRCTSDSINFFGVPPFLPNTFLPLRRLFVPNSYLRSGICMFRGR
jgi:hypothetical protein